jgi:transposase-like protein
MRRINVSPGEKYGDLEVVREVESKGKRHFLCECSCGKQVTVRLGHLRSGHSSSCGRCGVEYRGERKTIREWADQAGIKESTLRARLKLMPIREALKRG